MLCLSLLLAVSLEEAKTLSTPGNREEDAQPGKELEGAERTAFRALSARCNYLAQDRPDIQYATKEVCRAMQNPTDKDWSKVRRIGRYLSGAMRLVYKFGRQGKQTSLTGYSDTNWAGCPKSRRSTSAGGICHGDHLIRSWSKTQGTVAQSSAEAELGGMVKGSAELIGMAAVFRDLGMDTIFSVFKLFKFCNDWAWI